MISIQNTGLNSVTHHHEAVATDTQHLHSIKPLFADSPGPILQTKARQNDLLSPVAAHAQFQIEPSQENINQLMNDIFKLLEMRAEPQKQPVESVHHFNGQDLTLRKCLSEADTRKLCAHVQSETHLAMFHHFIRGDGWNHSDSQNLAAALTLRLSNNQELAHKDPQIVSSTIHQMVHSVKPAFIYGDSGSYFKKTGIYQPNGLPSAGTTNSVIKTPDGHLFELLNSPTHEQNNMIKYSAGLDIADKDINAGKLTLGSSSVGKIRLARHLQTNEIVVVKKFNDRYQAISEIKKYQAIGNTPGLASMRGYALSDHTDSNGQSKQGNYLFIRLANYGDGIDQAGRFNTLRLRNLPAATRELFLTAYQYTESLANLHGLDLVHRDVKPDNYGHCKSGEAMLLDFGCSERGNSPFSYKESIAGTTGFLPPEMYDDDEVAKGIQHDAWALGMTLLVLKNGTMPYSPQTAHLYINQQPVLLEKQDAYADTEGKADFKGIDRSAPLFQQLKYDTLDEVIAGLLDHKPDTRLTPAQALNTPYFRDFALQQGSNNVQIYQAPNPNRERLMID